MANIDYLIVGGGGGGGQGGSSGGGGGGGVEHATNYSPPSNSLAIVVGAGGAAGSGSSAGGDGGASSIGAVSASGGGGGGGDGSRNGHSGGSGGGGSANNGTGGGHSATEGHDGGAADIDAGGGGGGAGSNGQDGNNDVGGNGGIGYTSAISGAATLYGGGGGGTGASVDGSGGSGGGGAGNGGAGTDALGGGGGGGFSSAGVGGKGIVIIRYTTGTITATGGTITTDGGDTLHTFTSNDTFVISINGTLSVTLGSLICASTATNSISATLSKTLGALTLSSTAQNNPLSAILDKTLAALTLASTTTVSESAALSKILGALTLSSTSTVSISATLSQTLGAVTTASAFPYAIEGFTIEFYLGGSWVNVGTDLVAEDKLSIRYGIQGSGPSDRVAGTGLCMFTLGNWATSTGRPQGYYSPNHVNVRTGFTHGTRVRVTFQHAGISYVKFLGKLFDINPNPGLYRNKRVAIIATDWIDDLASFTVREIAAQTGQRTDQLLTTLIAAMPTDAQPTVSTSFAVGFSTPPYAFNNLGDGVNGQSLTADLVRSELGYFYSKGNGTPVFETRQDAAAQASIIDLTDTDITDLEVPSSLQDTFNTFLLTVHPKRVDTSLVVLFAQPTTDPPLLSPAEVRVFSFPYRDPSNNSTLIGGKAGSFSDPLTSTTDYTGNTLANGTGTDKTAALTVGVQFKASLCIVTVTNTDAAGVYLTKLQGRGFGIYDLSPQTYKGTLTQPYGERPFTLDLPYATDGNEAQDFATYLAAQFSTTIGKARSVAFNPQASYRTMLATMIGEPGKILTLTETISGLSAASQRIQSVELTLSPSLWLDVKWGLAPNYITDPWILEDSVSGKLDVTTKLGAL